MEQILLSIVIISFNTVEFIEKCLNAIYNDPPQFLFEVIVVDNGSTDGTVKFLIDQYPQIQLIRNPKNIYFAPANNQGFRLCKGKYFLILNSDVIVNSHALEAAVNFLENNVKAGAVGGVINHPLEDGSSFHGITYWKQRTLTNIIGKLEPWNHIFKGMQDKNPTNPSTGSIEVEILSDAFLLVRKNALERIGFYDERLLLYFTEDDLCVRLRLDGWKLYYLLNVEVFHHKGRSARKLPKSKITYISLRDRYFYIRKYWTPWVAVALLPLFFIHFIVIVFPHIQKRKNDF